MPRTTQADRKAKKTSAKVEDAEVPKGASGERIKKRFKQMWNCSVMLAYGPQLPVIAKEGVEEVKKISAGKTSSEPPKASAEGEAAEATPPVTEPAAETNATEPPAEGDAAEDEGPKIIKEPSAIFEDLKDRLTTSSLGLDEKISVNDIVSMKDREVDWGPRTKRGGSQAQDRILTNLHDELLQYVYIMLGLMSLRAFLFRSWFACLPWLLFYQYLSLVVPLKGSDKPSGLLGMIPIPWEKVPLEMCPVQIRVTITMAFHMMLWFFFIWETVYYTNWFEKIPLAGVIAYSAYVFRPSE